MSADASLTISPPTFDADALPSESACVFTLDGEPCGVDVRQVRAVVTLVALTRVPGAPTTLLGVTNVRGAVVPVVDLRPLLDLRTAPVVAGASAVILEDGDLCAALVVERVLGIERFERVERPADTSPFAAFASGALHSAGGTITMLDGPTILTTLRRAWAPAEDAVAP